MSFLYKGKPRGTTWNRHCCNFAGKKEGKKIQPRKSPSSRHVSTQQQKGKPEISEQVLIKAISSQSIRQYQGDRLPGLRVAWLNSHAWRCKIPLFLGNRSGLGTALHDLRWTSSALASDEVRGWESCSDLDFKKPVFCSRGGNWSVLCKKNPDADSCSMCSALQSALPYRGKESDLRLTS